MMNLVSKKVPAKPFPVKKSTNFVSEKVSSKPLAVKKSTNSVNEEVWAKALPVIVNSRKRRTEMMSFGCENWKKQKTTTEKGYFNQSALASANLKRCVAAVSKAKLDCEGKRGSTSLANCEENGPGSTPAATAPASVQGAMSPEKALRAAMLKARFADIILKASHPTLQHHDASGMQQHRLRLEKLRIEAEVAEAASRKRREQLNSQREAQRIALQNMRKTTDDSITMKDMEMLCSQSGYPNSILPNLGLYLRDIY